MLNNFYLNKMITVTKYIFNIARFDEQLLFTLFT